MKNIILTISFSILLCIVSCKSENKKSESSNESKENKISVKNSDSASVKKTEIKVDPDPDDNIPAESYGINSSDMVTAELVRSVLKNKFKDDLDKNIIDQNSRKFIFFEYDLNDDGTKEILVGLTGSYFCGSGGCTQYILDNKGNIVSEFTVSGYPVIIDNNKTGGWKNLIIRSGNKNHMIKYSGKTYPSNPSVQPEFKMIPGDELPRALNFENEPYPWFKF
jgi:hypothetical protein